MPWARFDPQSQGSGQSFSKKPTGKREGLGGKETKRRLGKTVGDLNFQLHFPTVMSSYFQGIQIMQPRCLSGYDFKDSKVFFSQEMKKSFYSCFISTNDFAFSFVTYK